MIVRGDTCFARAVVAVRAAGVVAIAAQPIAPAVVMARPLAAVRYSAGVQGRDGRLGAQGIPGASAGLATYTAAAVLSGDKALMFAGAGRVVPADPTAVGYVYAGIALGAAQIGGFVEVQSQGDVQASFWTWTASLPVFVAPSGNLTQTPPVFGRSHLIGWALDAQTIHLDPEPPIPIQ